MDTSAPVETLEARARAAYVAASLEADVEAARRRATDEERWIARAAEAAARAYGPDALDMAPTVETVAGRRLIVVHVAGGTRLATEPELPAALRGVIACPYCSAPDCRTAAFVPNLVELGRLLAAPDTFELLPHEGMRGGVCNGITEAEPAPRLRGYRVLLAGDAADIEDAMNELDTEGYEPSVAVGHPLSYVIGRQVSDTDPF